jgi:hypothetical protein
MGTLKGLTEGGLLRLKNIGYAMNDIYCSGYLLFFEMRVATVEIKYLIMTY